ncbi:MAG: SH3 domain-containing protein [Chloroflexota bacterium]|nr:SH3 domain-containing protein [Chloroflexota bacterium]
MKLPNLSLNELFRLPKPQPAFAGAAASEGNAGRAKSRRGGTMLFARGSDDDGYGSYDDDPPYEDPPQSTRRAPGAQRGGSGGSGNGGGSGSGGRQRSVQFQPEERYWTEYLRIALPIIGLLLMIGLFWYWASQLTNDDNGGGEPVATEPLGAAEMITPPSTPEPTTQRVVVPPTSPPAEEPVSTPDEQAPPPEEEPADTDPPEEEPAAEGDGFAVDDPVVVNDDGVNLRSAPTTAEDNVVTTLNTDDVLTILSGPEAAEDYLWWEVIVEETSETGYIVEDFIEPAQPAE